MGKWSTAIEWRTTEVGVTNGYVSRCVEGECSCGGQIPHLLKKDIDGVCWTRTESTHKRKKKNKKKIYENKLPKIIYSVKIGWNNNVYLNKIN